MFKLPRTKKKHEGLMHIVYNVHDDDIHGIIKIGDHHLISGSKDTFIYKWKIDELFKDKEPQPVLGYNREPKDYKHWVTAIHNFANGVILAGFRDSYILCFDVNTTSQFYGEQKLQNILLTFNIDENNSQHYKQRNQDRVTGILCQEANGKDKNYFALIGFPEKFIQVQYSQDGFKKKGRSPIFKMNRSFYFDKEEWAYGFAELNATTFVAIHGACLSIFKESKNLPKSWEKTSTLVSEKISRTRKQRPFISDVKKFQKNSWLALSFFGGKTQVIDVESGQQIHEGCEHRKRVWQALPVDTNQYISCADDGLIKTWDVREGKSIRTYKGHPGRVSALCQIDNNIFVAGTCPSDPYEAEQKGQFYFYDKRL